MRKHIYRLYFSYRIFIIQANASLLPVLQDYSLHKQLEEQQCPKVY